MPIYDFAPDFPHFEGSVIWLAQLPARIMFIEKSTKPLAYYELIGYAK